MSGDNSIIAYIVVAIILAIVKYKPSPPKSIQKDIQPDNDNSQHKCINDNAINKLEYISEVINNDPSEYRYPLNWSEIKKRIIQRDGYKCTICGKSYSLQVHHKTPISSGGTHSEYNLVTLCIDCHSEQGGLGHHNLVKLNYERSKREHLNKYHFKEVVTRKNYNCTFCNDVIQSGTASYVKYSWSINSYKFNNIKIPDSKTRLCILCFWEYPKYRN